MKRLENKTAIITGSTSGIGAACARLFAQNGASVVISGRNKEAGCVLQTELSQLGGTALYVPCDVSDERQIEALITKTIDAYGKLDILMNNAGIFFPSVELDRLKQVEWETTFRVNLDAYLLSIKYARPHLSSSHGCIVNIASIAGLHSYVTGRSYAYSTSKAAVIQLSQMMAKNYAEENIRVNCICPGIIETPMLHGRGIAEYGDRIPLHRLGTPMDVANAAVFLASDDAAYLTGVTLPVDGGVSLG